MRGRAEPEETGQAVEVALLLAEDEVDVLPEDLAVVEGLLPEEGRLLEDGLPPEAGLVPDEGLAEEDGFEPVEGWLADGCDGLSEDGGTFACTTGSPPPL